MNKSPECPDCAQSEGHGDDCDLPKMARLRLEEIRQQAVKVPSLPRCVECGAEKEQEKPCPYGCEVPS